ncbi:putative RiPP precursor [Halosimplex carlsbadense]|nr:putative RiPP precursor [Halosimplex carlsbadense]
MTRQQSNNEYTSPQMTEYGSVESITEQSNKEGGGTDQYSDNTPLVGSISPAS